ncbi:MAG: beta-N-acetylhexosaminidase [Pseudomonadota bacterium]
MPVAAILDCDGLELSADEVAFFREKDPWGFILFERNCEAPEQVEALCGALRDAVGRADAPILIDEEGGRVSRLKPPIWAKRPPMAAFGALYAEDRQAGLEAAKLNARLQADDLAAIGVNVNCAPVLDVPQPGAHDVIGDRAFAGQPDDIAALGRASAEGFLEGGVSPVIKHIPGHGRAAADSHAELPVVKADAEMLRAVDFAPFRALADAPMAMTAHVLYAAFDAKRPATTSPVVIGDVIRGEIGYDGLIMTDALTMKALEGSLADRARASLDAGCDVVLHCDGWGLMSFAEKAEVLDAASELSGEAQRRAERALALLRSPKKLDRKEAERKLANLLPTALA